MTLPNTDRKNFTPFAETLLTKHYSKPTDNSIYDIFFRAITNFSFGDAELAERLQHYSDMKWFNFSSPPLSNSVKGEWIKLDSPNGWKTHKFVTEEQVKAMPISCFVQYIPDTLKGQIEAAKELSWLSCSGGGVGQALGIRGITEKSPGPIPYLKTTDSNITYYKQGEIRRGSVASYLDISHPDILEFIGIRNPTGGDVNRKCHNINIAVNITDDFIEACDKDLPWELKCPHSGKVYDTIPARKLWQEILETRFKTGEPYIHQIDETNRSYTKFLKTDKFINADGTETSLRIKASNLCSEVLGHQDELNTVVCCLSSVNLEFYDEWKNTSIIEDCVTLLDNILEWFIENAPEELYKAVNFAKGFRDIGLGVMGWHYYLQKNNIPFESGGVGSAMQLSNIIFKDIKTKALRQSEYLATIRGEPEYLKGLGRRNAQLLAIAPTANNALIVDTTPSIELMSANIIIQRTRVGSHTIKNKYLDILLKELSLSYNEPDEWYNKQWKLIVANEGSVQNLECLTDHQKKVFKTAVEVDQRYIIDQARIRQQYICQSQSVNLFFSAGVSKKYVNDVHRRAFSTDLSLPGVPLKTLYYCRSSKEQKLEKVSGLVIRNKLSDYETQELNKSQSVASIEAEECLSCHG